MRKIVLCCFATIVAFSAVSQPKLTPKNIDKIVKELTLEEKAHLVIGGRHLEQNKDMAGEVGYTGRIIPGAAGVTYPVPRLGIPAIVVADGPAGLRILPKREGESQT
jgi:beta-glucosidase